MDLPREAIGPKGIIAPRGGDDPPPWVHTSTSKETYSHL